MILSLDPRHLWLLKRGWEYKPSYYLQGGWYDKLDGSYRFDEAMEGILRWEEQCLSP